MVAVDVEMSVGSGIRIEYTDSSQCLADIIDDIPEPSLKGSTIHLSIDPVLGGAPS